MMTSTEIRRDARNHLTKKWRKGALITLTYFIIEFVINYLSTLVANLTVLSLIVSIAITVISVPISYGLIISFMKLKRDEDVYAFDFLSLGFSNFSRAWKVGFSMLKKLIIPIILVFISNFVMVMASSYASPTSTYHSITGTASSYSNIAICLSIIGLIAFFASSIYCYIKQLSLVLSYNIAYDEPNLTTRQAVEKSQILMKGNKGNYFVLSLSFIGWAFLTIFTLGIGLLWLIPYIQVSTVCFYEFLAGKNLKNSDEKSDNVIEVNE